MLKRRRGTCQRGLTLLELLVALSIFALLSAAGYGALRSVLDARAAVAANSARLHALQLAWTLLERDLEQAVARPVRDEFGLLRPALTTALGDDLLRLTRSGWDNPLGQPRATLQRIALRFRAADGVLERRYWPTLDRVRDRPQTLALLDGVEAVELRLLDRSGRWQTRWPPIGSDAAAIRLLPRAVELRLRLRDWGDIARLFVLADGL